MSYRVESTWGSANVPNILVIVFIVNGGRPGQAERLGGSSGGQSWLWTQGSRMGPSLSPAAAPHSVPPSDAIMMAYSAPQAPHMDPHGCRVCALLKPAST